MRLIDADALIAKQASIAKTFARSDAQKSLMGRVMYNTERAPTIDAVPVEWLKQWRDKLKGMGEYQHECAEDISFVLGLWQKEQEAQDG